MVLKKNYDAVYKLFEAFHELRSGNKPPDSRMVAGVLFCITNQHLINLLLYLLKNPTVREASLAQSKRSSLFDKLILIRGSEPKPWVLRLHTYQIPKGSATGPRVSNLEEELKDDEANTHFHRWQLGSRFLTGGFNNVTWDVNDEDNGGERQIKYGLPATVTAKSTKARDVSVIGESWVKERRSDFYMEGDVIAYPIADAHSVSASMAPFVGTTMTFAHTGREEYDDSSFFKSPSGESLKSVAQVAYTKEQHIEAIGLAITRLQLIELTKYLASRPRDAEAFGHMNSFETELLPRIAELFVMYTSSEKRWFWGKWVSKAQRVDLDEKALGHIAAMDSDALAWLIIASQKHLLDKSFVKDVQQLSHYHREFTTLTSRINTGVLPLNGRRY